MYEEIQSGMGPCFGNFHWLCGPGIRVGVRKRNFYHLTAMKSADGREMVEALLVDSERMAAHRGKLHEAEREAIKKVRRELGLGSERMSQ